MKLLCHVQISNRLIAGNSLSGSRKLKSLLSIGRQTVKSDDLHLLLQTSLNKNGIKYKVTNNVEKVFTKFVDEGKITIRLKDPAVDLNIQCDAVVQLKSFLHVLKLGLSKKLDPGVLNVSNLNKKNFPAALRTKIVIKQASAYPTLEGFPRTTEQLYLSGLERRSFDRQILKLQSLKILNLSDNKISSLPQELGMLPNLQELNVSNNLLGKSPISKWTWLSGKHIRNTLYLLNLSSNKIAALPKQINKLHNLVSLYLNNNSITYLPDGIGNLNKLKYLNLSKNHLQYLPGSMKNLSLSELDISDTFNIPGQVTIMSKVGVPSFVDLAGKTVLQTRIYYDASIIPYTLVHYLDNAHYCLCGAPCFNTFIRRFVAYNPSAIAHSIQFSSTDSRDVLFECYFCSIKCFRKYFNTL